jgi:hypothetical protein
MDCAPTPAKGTGADAAVNALTHHISNAEDIGELPGAVIVLIRYRGIFFETGYTTEAALLLTSKP